MGIANYLKNLIVEKSLKVVDGRVKMFGKIDYVMLPASGMAEILQKIGKDFGENYSFKLGYKTGTDGADEMIERLGLLDKKIQKNLGVIQKMFESLGFGKINIKILKPEQGKGLMTLTDHPAIDYSKVHFGNKSKVCAHYRGIFSVHAEKELKLKNSHLVETQCICKNDSFCEWSSGVFEKKKT